MSNRMRILNWLFLLYGVVFAPAIMLFWSRIPLVQPVNVYWTYGFLMAFPLTLCGVSTITLLRDRNDNRPESVGKSKSIAVWWVGSFILLAPINFFAMQIFSILYYITLWIQGIIFVVSLVYFGLRIFRSKES